MLDGSFYCVHGSDKMMPVRYPAREVGGRSVMSARQEVFDA